MPGSLTCQSPTTFGLPLGEPGIVLVKEGDENGVPVPIVVIPPTLPATNNPIEHATRLSRALALAEGEVVKIGLSLPTVAVDRTDWRGRRGSF